MDETAFVHIVTFNSEQFVGKAVRSVLAQHGLSSFHLHITDNASSDGTVEILRSLENDRVSFFQNTMNLGFCGAHNQGVKRFLEGDWRYLIILNPDVVLEPQCIALLIDGAKSLEKTGLATPKLLRAGDSLDPVTPRTLDAAGMVLEDSLRHFDRGSQETDGYFVQEVVFGGTGACLLLSRECVKELLLKGDRYDNLKSELFPQLLNKENERAPLFDEAFFAYREDADLSWRANLLGWKCLYVPAAIGYHRRVVFPSNRRETSSILNGLSVRNRFLLQCNNYFLFKNSLSMFLTGFLLRNLVVLIGVILSEWRSVLYLYDGLKLLPRAWERRRILWERIHG